MCIDIIDDPSPYNGTNLNLQQTIFEVLVNLDRNLNEYPSKFQIYLTVRMKNCLLYEIMWFLYRVYEYESDYERKIVTKVLS